VVKRGKQKARLRLAHLPSTQFQKAKYKQRPLSDREKELASRIQDWEDLSDKEQQTLLSQQLEVDNPMASGSGSGTTLPPTQPTIADIMVLVHDIGQAVGQLTTQVTALTAQVAANVTAPAAVAAPNKKDIVSKPKPWDGKGGSTEARHFLAAFNNWGFGQERAMNTLNPATNMWHREEQKWIQAVLNHMEGDACTWVLPHLEELLNLQQAPFRGSWATFESEFTKRFIPLDISETARDALKKIKQSKMSVAEYQSMFDQYSKQTGWSDNDHHQRFYDGLTDCIKDALSLTNLPIETLEELRTAVWSIDQRLRQRDAEKKGGSYNPTTSSKTHKSDAMQVDASRQQQGRSNNKSTKSRADFQNFMKGKCYGCGKMDHSKKDGNHERDVCNYCQKTGHRSNVCMIKYMGKPAKAKVVATMESPTSSSTPSSDSTSAVATASATTAPAKGKSQVELMARLMEQVKKQQEQITALSVAF